MNASESIYDKKVQVLDFVKKEGSIKDTENQKQAARMLYEALISGVHSLKNNPNFSHLPPASLEKAEQMFQGIREKFGLERRDITQDTTRALGEFREKISPVDTMGLSAYLVKNTNLRRTHEWSENFYRAYKSGKIDISGDRMLQNYDEYNRNALSNIYKKAYTFLLAQDMSRILVRTYRNDQSKRIAECLAKLCMRGVGTIEPSHTKEVLSGSLTLSALGVGIDIGSDEESLGKMGSSHGGLTQLNTIYQDFIEGSIPAQIALENGDIQKENIVDRIAMEAGVDHSIVTDNGRDFQVKSGKTLAQLEEKAVSDKAKLHARMRQKGMMI